MQACGPDHVPAGHEVREQMFDEVADLLRSLDEGMLPISVFFPYAPIEAHRKRDKCVGAMDVLVAATHGRGEFTHTHAHRSLLKGGAVSSPMPLYQIHA